MDPYVGEIKLVGFTFAPLGWAFCNGQLLSIGEYETLFTLIGTTYGGDGQQTFALPDLRGRAAIHNLQGNGLSNVVLGQMGGVEEVTLTSGQIPSHTHQMAVGSALGTQGSPVGQHLAQSPMALGNVYAPSPDTALPANAVASTGGNMPHDNMQPYLAMNYIISLFGVFPAR